MYFFLINWLSGFFSAVQNPEIFHAEKFCILKHHHAFDLFLFEIQETCVIA